MPIRKYPMNHAANIEIPESIYQDSISANEDKILISDLIKEADNMAPQNGDRVPASKPKNEPFEAAPVERFHGGHSTPLASEPVTLSDYIFDEIVDAITRTLERTEEREEAIPKAKATGLPLYAGPDVMLGHR